MSEKEFNKAVDIINNFLRTPYTGKKGHFECSLEKQEVFNLRNLYPQLNFNEEKGNIHIVHR